MNGRSVAGTRMTGAVAGYRWPTMGQMLRAGVAEATRVMKIRRDRKHLYSMPDHLLKDIGISRSEIDQAVMFGGPGGNDRTMLRRGRAE